MQHDPLFFDPFELATVEPVHVVIPASARDPRDAEELPWWIVPHYVPELHPDDRDVVDGVPCTSLSRTLLDMAECSTEAELWELFARADEVRGLDPDALRAARARVEWRPSLGLFDRVLAQFID